MTIYDPFFLFNFCVFKLSISDIKMGAAPTVLNCACYPVNSGKIKKRKRKSRSYSHGSSVSDISSSSSNISTSINGSSSDLSNMTDIQKRIAKLDDKRQKSIILKEFERSILKKDTINAMSLIEEYNYIAFDKHFIKNGDTCMDI